MWLNRGRERRWTGSVVHTLTTAEVCPRGVVRGGGLWGCGHHGCPVISTIMVTAVLGGTFAAVVVVVGATGAVGVIAVGQIRCLVVISKANAIRATNRWRCRGTNFG